MNYNMNHNGERWLVKRLSSSRKSCTFVDIGANAGDWSAMVLDVAPAAKVYVVEMIPSFASKLRHRFSERVTVIEAALSDQRGPVTAYRLGGGGRIPIGLGAGKKSKEVFDLQTRRGDDIVAEHDVDDIALIKIDVDGYDVLALRGFLSAIKKQRPVVQFEYSRFYIFTRCYLKDAYELFSSMDYQVGRLMPGWIAFSEYTTGLEMFKSNNFVAVPSEKMNVFRQRKQ